MLFEITSWIQSLMVYEIENAKLTLRAFGQTQFITCIFWKSLKKIWTEHLFQQTLYSCIGNFFCTKNIIQWRVVCAPELVTVRSLACPTPLTVDTAGRFIQLKYTSKYTSLWVFANTIFSSQLFHKRYIR